MGVTASAMESDDACAACTFRETDEDFHYKKASSSSKSPTLEHLEMYACARKFGASAAPIDVRKRYRERTKASRGKALLLKLPKEVILRIVLEVAFNSSYLDDIFALSATCGEFWIQLQDENHPLWVFLFHRLVGTGRFHGSCPRFFELGFDVCELSETGAIHQLGPACVLKSPLLQDSEDTSPRQWCLWLLSAALLLRSSLTSCDWLSLADAVEVLSAAGLRQPGAFSIIIVALVAWQDLHPAAQALQWLREIATGQCRPWSDSVEPTPEAMRIDSLRQWLHNNVSDAIKPWHARESLASDGTIALDVFSTASADTTDVFTKHVACMAAFTLLAVECLAPGPCVVLSSSDYAAAVEGAIVESWDLKTWPLLLLLLARAHRTLAEMGVDINSYSFWNPMEESSESQRTGALTEAWRGLAFSWRPKASRGLFLEALCFPALFYDQRWFHSQHGMLRVAGINSSTGMLPVSGNNHDFVYRKTVQLDAKFDVQAESFRGHWFDHESFQPLPARVYKLEARFGGLLRWMSTGSSNDEPIQNYLAQFSGLADERRRHPEFFGIVGEATDDTLTCFYLSPPIATSTQEIS